MPLSITCSKYKAQICPINKRWLKYTREAYFASLPGSRLIGGVGKIPDMISIFVQGIVGGKF
jgi:hypothetical protein